MWYYTKHKIYAPLNVIEDLRDSNEEASIAFDEIGDISEPVKWYWCYEEVKLFSQKYKDILIQIEWYWENSPDIWKDYFMNWKWYHTNAKIVFEEFDENKLE